MTTNINLLMSTLDLNKYEAMMIFELLKENPLQAKHFHSRSGIPRSRIYDIGINLQRKGYLEIEEPKKIRIKKIDQRSREYFIEKVRPTTFKLLTEEEIVKLIKRNLLEKLKTKEEALKIVFNSIKGKERFREGGKQ